MEFKEEEVVTKKSTIDVQSGEVHKVTEKDNTVSVVFQEEKNELDKIINDSSSDDDMKDLAKSELSTLISKSEKVEKKLKLFLLPKDEADKKNAIIEIRAGTGGLEASLFAADLFKMYEKICNKKKGQL